MKDFQDKLDELNRALEASKKTMTQGPAFFLEDQMDLAKKYLTDRAIQTFSNKSKSLYKTDGLGNVVAQAIYFGVRIRKENLEKGVAKIAEAMNKLAEFGWVDSILAPIASLELARMPLSAPTKIVICYPVVNIDKVEEAKKIFKDVSIEEGEVPESMDSLVPDLKDGEFLAEIRVSPVPSLVGLKDREDTLAKTIEQYLSFLPENTVVREITQCAITDLSIPYEVKFYNPIMGHIKYVEAKYVRHAAKVDGEFKQANLLAGVEYFDITKKPLFIW